MREARVVTLEAIVLKRKNAGEADRLLTVFTRRKGKLRIVAKGVRKITSRRGPHVEVFNRVLATVHDGKTLTEVSTMETFAPVRKDLSRVGAAYYLCELVDGLLPEAQPHDDVFALLLQAFTTLGTVEKSRVPVLRERFARSLLRKLGFLAEGKEIPDIDRYIESLLERKLKTVYNIYDE